MFFVTILSITAMFALAHLAVIKTVSKHSEYGITSQRDDWARFESFKSPRYFLF